MSENPLFLTITLAAGDDGGGDGSGGVDGIANGDVVDGAATDGGAVDGGGKTGRNRKVYMMPDEVEEVALPTLLQTLQLPPTILAGLHVRHTIPPAFRST